MKKVVIVVPRKKADALVSSLKGMAYTVDEEEDWVRYTLFVLDEMLDEMIEKTQNSLGGEPRTTGPPHWLGIIPEIRREVEEDDRYSLIEVSTPDFVISPFLDKLKKEWQARVPMSRKTPIEEILAATESLSVYDHNKVLLAAIAGIVALIGLFVNNIGIIIGAMLLSPLLGPIYALSINIAVGDRKKTWRCISILVIYVLMLVGIAAIVTLPLSYVIDLPLTAEILARTDSNAIYIVMATLLGFATIIAMSKGIPEGIAGVAIAAALLPPAVVTGICAIIYPAGFFKALTLTLQNIVGLVTGSLIGVFFMGIGPRDLFEYYRAKQTIGKIAWLLAVSIILLIIISFLL
jgi:uncharacterized hydrophobic protein (TIGR00341 family)